MEQPGNSSIFGLSIDTNSKIHLAEAARWGRFLAIVGFIGCGLLVVFGLFFGSFMGRLGGTYTSMGVDNPYANAGGFIGGVMAVTYILMALLYFFPCLFLFRFANGVKTALLTNEQDKLNYSFQNLKALLRFMGILAIIGLVFIALGLLFGLAGAAMM